jgi:hypothetical protein
MRLPALILLVALPFAATAQQVLCALGSGLAGYRSSSDERPTGDAMELIGRTFTAARAVCGGNCPETVLFRNTTAANLMLIIAGGRGKVVYSPPVFEGIYAQYGDPGIIALLAHVLGHELDDAMGAAWIEKSWTPELRADAWAGCILAKVPIAGTELTAALRAMADYPSPMHPAWNVRLPAIRTGYTHCGNQ